MKLAGICLITKDVGRLRAFYENALGAQATGDDTHTEISTQGAGLAIFSEEGMEGMAPGSTQGIGCGSVTLMFEIQGVDEAYARVHALGAGIVKPPQTHPWGSRAFWFRDPDGNIVDFYEIVK